MIYDEIRSALRAKREEREEILSIFPATNHAIKAINVSSGSITKSTPAPVATPFPPSSLR